MGDFREVAGIKVGQRDKVRAEMEKASAEAKAARAELQKLRDSAEAEGVDLSPESDAFVKLTEANKVFAVANQRALELQDAYKALLEVDGSLQGTVADGFAVGTEKAKEIETQKGHAKKNFIVQAVETFMTSDDYKAVRKQLAEGRTDVMARRRIELEELISREAVARLWGIPTFQAAGDNVVTGASDTSGGAFVWPEEDHGLVDLAPFRAPRVLDVLNRSTTDRDAIEYVTVATKTNAAAAVAEASDASTGAYAESALTTAVASVVVENVGHYIPVTARAIADAGELDNLLRTFLIEGVMVALETEVLTGGGTTPNLDGLYTDVTQAQPLGGDAYSDSVLKAQTAVRVNAQVNDSANPDTIIFYPTDLQDLRLQKDDNGNYIFGGPTAPMNFPIWGMRPVEALGATSGTPILGDFRFARLWVRSGVSVSVSDSNSDWFIRDILTMKANIRAAFKAVKIGAFCELTGW